MKTLETFCLIDAFRISCIPGFSSPFRAYTRCDCGKWHGLGQTYTMVVGTGWHFSEVGLNHMGCGQAQHFVSCLPFKSFVSGGKWRVPR